MRAFLAQRITMAMSRLGLRLLSVAVVSLWAWTAAAQVYPNIPANTFLGRLGSGNPGPPQPIPFALLSGQILSNISGDCTVNAGGVITCTKTNNTLFGTFATQSYATPPAIGGTTPAAGTFTALPAATLNVTGATTTNLTGSTQCVQANSSGVLSGAGASCNSYIPGIYTLSHASGSWVCTDPGGNIINTSSTTTSGLQDCLSALNSGKLGNFRAICPDPASGIYIAASTTITFGPSAGVSYDLRGCRLVSTATSVAVLLETLEFGTHLDWSAGQIECTGAATCVKLNPSLADPLFGSYGISWGYIDFGTIMTSGCASDGAQAAAIDFNSNGGVSGSHNAAIYAEKIKIGAIDGFDGTHNCFSAGITAENPTNAFAAFGQNYIYVGYIQGFSTWGVTNGTGAVTQATQALATNQWDIGTIGSDANHVGNPTGGFLQYGFFDRINTNISVNSGSLADGLVFNAATANGNWFTVPQLGGTTPLVDSGTTVKNYGFYNGGGYKTGGTF